MRAFLSIHRFLITLFVLIGSLTAWQTLYACDLMEQPAPSNVCCCESGNNTATASCESGGSCLQQTETTAPCCDISYQSPTITSAQHLVQQAQILLPAKPLPPPLAMVKQTFSHPLGTATYQPAPLTASNSLALYLSTRRLRI